MSEFSFNSWSSSYIFFSKSLFWDDKLLTDEFKRYIYRCKSLFDDLYMIKDSYIYAALSKSFYNLAMVSDKMALVVS